MFGTLKGIVGYCRVSTNMQVQEGASLEAQKAGITRYAESINTPLINIYVDEGISGGGSIEDRPQLLKMLSELKRDILVVIPSISRLARNTSTFLEILNKIKKLGCELYDLEKNIHTGTSTGMLLVTFLSTISDHERKEIAQRGRAAMLQMKKTGEVRSQPPYGFKFAGKRKPFEAVEEEQRAILFLRKYIYKNEGMINYSEMTRELEKEQISPPKKSAAWRGTKIKNILMFYDIIDQNGKYIDTFRSLDDPEKPLTDEEMEKQHEITVRIMSTRGMRSSDVEKYNLIYEKQLVERREREELEQREKEQRKEEEQSTEPNSKETNLEQPDEEDVSDKSQPNINIDKTQDIKKSEPKERKKSKKIQKFFM